MPLFEVTISEAGVARAHMHSFTAVHAGGTDVTGLVAEEEP